MPQAAVGGQVVLRQVGGQICPPNYLSQPFTKLVVAAAAVVRTVVSHHVITLIAKFAAVVTRQQDS